MREGYHQVCHVILDLQDLKAFHDHAVDDDFLFDVRGFSKVSCQLDAEGQVILDDGILRDVSSRTRADDVFEIFGNEDHIEAVDQKFAA